MPIEGLTRGQTSCGGGLGWTHLPLSSLHCLDCLGWRREGWESEGWECEGWECEGWECEGRRVKSGIVKDGRVKDRRMRVEE